MFAYGYNATRIVTGAVTGGMDPANAMFFDSMEELVTLLKMRAEPGDVLLFKGSRGMKMEQALELFLSDKMCIRDSLQGMWAMAKAAS